MLIEIGVERVRHRLAISHVSDGNRRHHIEVIGDIARLDIASAARNHTQSPSAIDGESAREFSWHRKTHRVRLRIGKRYRWGYR